MLWFLATLYSEWRAGYVVLYQPTNPTNLIKYNAVGAYERLVTPYVSSIKAGLPVRRIYFPEQARLSLEQDLPENVKKWQRGFALFPDEKLHKIKIRFRGDNPFNWAYEKKSWRIKTRKSDLLNDRRRINFVKPREASNVNLYLGHFIASKVGVMAADARPVELFINDRSEGVYIEMPDLDETFLRAHGVMPVNLYKGEQENQERRYGSEPFLFNNPALWDKEAVFNQIPKNDRSDLKKLFDVAQRAQSSLTAYERLKEIAPLNEWARFSAYQTLVQSWHNSSYHNQRLVADPWRGIIFPISHDTGVNFELGQDGVQLDSAKHIVSRTLYHSTEFLLRKYNFILDFVRKGLFDEVISELDNIAPKLIKSYERDPSRLRTAVLNGQPVSDGSVDAHAKLIAKLRSDIRILEKSIVDKLTGPPNASWTPDAAGFSLIVKGNRLATNVHLGGFNSELPKRIAWDRDGDGVLSQDDLDLPFRATDVGLEISATFAANRIQPTTSFYARGEITTASTRFRIVADKPLEPTSVTVENPFDGVRIDAAENKKINAVTPGHLNLPVFKKPLPEPLRLSGQILIDKDSVFSVPVKIAAGTVIEVAEGKGIVFKAGVKMHGSPTSPIIFRSVDIDKVWGAVALTGAGSSHSELRNVIINGGSGMTIGGQRFIAMLSIHDTSDVLLDHVHLSDNHIYDDMLHVVYSKNIKIRDSSFMNARADAIDIDMSTVDISGLNINNAKNDAIDLMSSSVVVDKTNITGSGDKGLSVGEASIVLVTDTQIEKSNIGVEAKDRSIAVIHNSVLHENEKTFNAYDKNWRYSGGGKILADGVFISSSRKPITADKRSSIKIYNSWTPTALEAEGNVELTNLNMSMRKPEFAPAQLPIIDEILKSWNAGQPESLLP